jgi:recombination protein RecA
MPIDPSGFDAIAKAIEKKMGAGTIHDASQTPYVDRLSWRSHELDFATGRGAPIGRVIRLFGAPSSGKSLACWNLIKSAQDISADETARLSQLVGIAKVNGDKGLERDAKDSMKRVLDRWPDGMMCVYYNIEKQFDKRLVETMGLNTKKLQIVEGTVIEDVAQNLEALMSVAHVHVMDSLSSAIALDELSGKIEDWHIGLKARVWGKVLRRVIERFDHRDNILVLVDQVRDVFGTGTEAPPGGRAIEHASDMTIHFKRGAWLFSNQHGILDRDGDKGAPTLSGQMEPKGMEIQARVQKSRVGQPFRTARMHLDFATMQYDTDYELVKAAKHFGLVQVNGGWWQLPSGQKVQGQHKFRQLLADTPELREEISAKMMDAAGS